jgi:hypothetical protein
MVFKSRYFALLLLLSAFVVGCGQGSTEVQQVAVPTADILKASLKNPAETGQLGSELITIEESIAKLQTEKSANADALAKDLEELKTADTPAKVKAKAKEMQGKL